MFKIFSSHCPAVVWGKCDTLLWLTLFRNIGYVFDSYELLDVIFKPHFLKHLDVNKDRLHVGPCDDLSISPRASFQSDFFLIIISSPFLSCC